jgi:hypothetical protein
MATIESRVKSALTGRSALMALVTDVVHAYPKSFKDISTAKGVISYYKIQDETEHCFGGDNYSYKIMVIDIWSKSSALNNRIADEVTAALSFMLKDIEVDAPDPNIEHKNIKYFIHE